jgi:hypothetical protein
MSKLTLTALQSLKVGQGIPDPAVNAPGCALRYRRKANGLYADFMWKAGPGKWLSKSLGKLPSGAELDDLIAGWEKSQRISNARRAQRGEPPIEPRPVERLDMMLAEVRGEAHRLRRQLRGGQDLRGAITLGRALEMHLASKERSPRTVTEYRDKVRLHFGDWADLPLSSISRRMAKERHQRITRESGAYAANGAMRVFRAVWNRAMREDESLPACPTINVDFHQEHRRDAAIPQAQLPAWWQAIGELANPRAAGLLPLGPIHWAPQTHLGADPPGAYRPGGAHAVHPEAEGWKAIHAAPERLPARADQRPASGERAGLPLALPR